MDTTQDLFQGATTAKIIPIKPARKTDGTFVPVVLGEAPADIQAMPEGELEEKIAKAVAVLAWAMERFEICFSFSGGKDSSTVLSIGLAAARRLVAEGKTVKRFAVLTSDTMVENPEVLAVARGELRKIQEWIDRYELPGEVHVTHPALSAQFAVTIIGGKSIISTPTTNRNCTTDMKSAPLHRKRIEVFGHNKVEKGDFVVGVTGVRFGESRERSANMEKRAESPVQVVMTDAGGSVFLAPIAYWDTDDVMEFIGLAVNDMLPLEIYTDLKDVWRIYRDAAGECQVGAGDKPSKGCSARHGCYVCNMVQADKSMDAFLSQERYAYMQPLADFREYLFNTVHDLSKRTWVGRSIEKGYIKFAPDAYAPAYLQDLLRYALTIDQVERENAAELKIKPRFQLVGLEALIAIDAQWSLQGFALPFTALKIFRDVVIEGQRYPVPKVPMAPKGPLPAPRYIYVGEEWDDTAVDNFTGLRDPILESMEGPCTATRTLQTKSGTRTVMQVDTEPQFTVDPESAMLILEFELDRLVEQYHGIAKVATIGGAVAAQGYRWYASYGAIAISRAKVAEIDMIMRRTAWRERLGLAGYNYDHDKALAMSVAEIPVKPEPTAQEVREKAMAEAEARRQDRVYAVRRKALTLRELHRDWSNQVPWRQLLQAWRHEGKTCGLPHRRVPAYCLSKSKRYHSGRRAMSLQHFVFLGDLVGFIKANPDIAEKVKAHRSPRHKRGAQLSMFAA